MLVIGISHTHGWTTSTDFEYDTAGRAHNTIPGLAQFARAHLCSEKGIDPADFEHILIVDMIDGMPQVVLDRSDL